MSKRELALEEAVRAKKAKGVKTGEPASVVELHGKMDPLPAFRAGECLADPARIDSHIVCVNDPYSLAAEQYKRIRARILRATTKEFLNTIMITSPDKGEGKTIAALNLAIAMAEDIDHTVLLVDADLRNPSVHRYLGIETTNGLSEYLLGKTTLSDALINTGLGKLVILPAGPPADKPSELLSSQRMKMLIQELKHRYRDRYILFDTSPVLATSEPLSLARHMDGIVLLVQAAYTAPKAAAKAVALMKDCAMLGVIFNSVPSYLSKRVHFSHYIYEKFKRSDKHGDDKRQHKTASAGITGSR